MSPRSRFLAAFGLVFALSCAAPFVSPPRASADGPLVLGFSGEGGGFVTDPQSAMGGLALRLGVRPIPLLSIYLQSHGLIGALTAGPESGSAQGVLWNTAMLGVHFGPLHLAFGPSLDFAWGCDTQEGCVDGDLLFGLDGRVALHFGSLVLSADVHPTWIDDDIVVGLVGGLGWQL
ncbi:hypothetical protein [Sandaracinus amylolyticus]|uniref:hypothetical protein n=1 Tax=Sandaracinus amylolyticus TaxID=927083 RepID=UPI001F24C937|nr:hypothetical protein [Sandaracinus amylolyticus]UJR78225.1 Hypothetical protein I5071_2520 [Sandaracinus amylolyticus]